MDELPQLIDNNARRPESINQKYLQSAANLASQQLPAPNLVPAP